MNDSANKRFHHIAALAMVWIVLVQAVVVMVSWSVTAMFPNLYMRSIFSADGLRWIFGRSFAALSTNVLVCLLLLFMACGAVRGSKMLQALGHRRLLYRERLALRCVLAEIVLYLAVVGMLTLAPHALLLSVTGSLFPSSFSVSIIHQLAVLACVSSVSYGLVSGSLVGIDDVLTLLCSGIRTFAPLFVIYILGAELYFSVCFIMMW